MDEAYKEYNISRLNNQKPVCEIMNLQNDAVVAANKISLNFGKIVSDLKE